MAVHPSGRPVAALLCDCSFLIVAQVQRTANWTCLTAADAGQECDSRRGQLTIRVRELLASPNRKSANPARHRPAVGELMLIQIDLGTGLDTEADNSLPAELTTADPGLGQLDKLLRGQDFILGINTEMTPGDDEVGGGRVYSSTIWPMKLMPWVRHTIRTFHGTIFCPRPYTSGKGTGSGEIID